MSLKLFNYFEALPIDPKSLKGRGIVSVTQKAKDELLAKENSRLDKIIKRAEKYPAGFTKEIVKKLTDIGSKDREGTSRIVFASDSPKSIIKIAKSSGGVAQNKTELDFINFVSKNAKAKVNIKKIKNIKKLGDTTTFVPKIFSIDKDSDYAKKGFPLWVEFERLNPVGTERELLDKFCEQYGFMMRNEDFYFPTHIPNLGSLEEIFRKPLINIKKDTLVSVEMFVEKWKSILKKNTFEAVRNRWMNKKENELEMKNSDLLREIGAIESRYFEMHQYFILNSYKYKKFIDFVLQTKDFKKEEVDKAINEFSGVIDKASVQYMAKLKSIEANTKQLYDFFEIAKNYGLSMREITHSRQWGVNSKGEFKLLDYGLNSKVFNRYYEGKK